MRVFSFDKIQGDGVAEDAFQFKAQCERVNINPVVDHGDSGVHFSRGSVPKLRVTVHGPAEVSKGGREAESTREQVRDVTVQRTEANCVQETGERRRVHATEGQPAEVCTHHEIGKARLTAPAEFIQDHALATAVHREQDLFTRGRAAPP